MVTVFWRVLLAIAFIGSVASTVVLILGCIGAWKFRRETASDLVHDASAALAPVSVLKPVHNAEPRLYENLESYFVQEYPRYELIFCARTRDNAALEVVDQLMAKYPQVDARIVTCGEPPFANAVMHSLITMFGVAKYDTFIFSDSDVYATRDYVRNVTAPLADAKVGATTCLYRGVPIGGFAALIDALGLTIEMSNGVLIARWLEGMKFTLGPTIGIRRDVIKTIGGLEQFQQFCANDFELGREIDLAGLEVRLSAHIIEQMAAYSSYRASLVHQRRWMLSARFSRPHGHIGTVFMFAAPFGLLGLIAACALGYPLLGAALIAASWLNRTMQALAIGSATLHDPLSRRYCWLYWWRDLQGFFVWCSSFFGNEVVWREERYRLIERGRMVRAAD
jgi:ceramide glucosyltransferase